MNYLQRLFKRKIEGEELDNLILDLGENKGYIIDMKHCEGGWSVRPTGRLDTEISRDKKKIEIELNIQLPLFHSATGGYDFDKKQMEVIEK